MLGVDYVNDCLMWQLVTGSAARFLIRLCPPLLQRLLSLGELCDHKMPIGFNTTITLKTFWSIIHQFCREDVLHQQSTCCFINAGTFEWIRYVQAKAAQHNSNMTHPVNTTQSDATNNFTIVEGKIQVERKWENSNVSPLWSQFINFRFDACCLPYNIFLKFLK